MWFEWRRCAVANGFVAKTMIGLAAFVVGCAGGLTAGETNEIIFAVRQAGAGGHWYENFGYYAFNSDDQLSGGEGRLCRLNLETGKLTVLLDDAAGAIRDPQVHYDGRKILFSYRKGGSDNFHLYEIGIDGRDLIQLTSGAQDDIEPTYLPDGRIMFCSSRCHRWVPCWYSPVAILHCCDADGSHVRPVSGNIEHDNTPWPMPDGRVLYERWEYVDRSRVSFHHLWTSNPDGSGQMVFYGNMHPGTLMIDAKPLPDDTGRVVAVFSPKHGRKEHAGAIAIVSPKRGPDDSGSATLITSDTDFRDPYPVASDRFLVARGPAILWMNERGETDELFRLPKSWAAARALCHEPRPLQSRRREPILSSKTIAQETIGRLFLQDVCSGQKMQSVQPGEIKRLLVLETLPKPINYTGKMPPISFGGTYMIERILGTVPVESDGSAYFEVPALRPLFFVALDEHNNSVQRMHSFVTVMPGETLGCVGCHEHRTQSATMVGSNYPLAMHRPIRSIQKLAGIPDVFDFPRDIQPILDRHCVRCHDDDRRDGGIALTGDRGPIYSHSYFTLTALGYISDGRDRVRTNLPPRSVGTSASPLMKMLDGRHYNAKLTPHEQDMLRYWIESAAAYPGTYAALGTGMIGGFPKSRLETSDRTWPASKQAAEVIERRCAGCHDKSRPLPRYLSDNMGFVLSNPDFSDVRVRYSRHLLFDLTRPEKSLMLLAPLAKEAGGLGLCRDADRTDSKPAASFMSTSDADYQRILALCEAGKRHLDRIKRFDMPGFRPTETYVREMKRYGILPLDQPPDAMIDVYATDAAYWRSLWWHGGNSPDDL